ncbi:methionine gamma-lyase [Brevibacillus centrosporus]|uniref:methionine gamma-lyase n=1 Tax=Brevibacillus centrosporus TaxID=54910 RepID=UPI000F09CC9C|nr:methionine gamma-lyase [Brevibacillus centrosporus]MEC2132305.1 methionine gamma-lyase [Brevibacillus centrosporus]MED4909455.1 methionine gamma-lyase [Brevibacillus centrosporus]RNB72362.1 methionine gamma-lyase [Brevibacillus centrosporus]GED33167.1 L-methionine gamma-lyase [Brevibacillus centrosporus]
MNNNQTVQAQKKQGRSTTAIHAGYHADPQTGALATPIYQTSTFVFASTEEGARRFAGEEAGYVYSRLGNPTVTVLEEKIAALEKAEAGLAFASGMAAVSAVLMALVKSGDHILGTKGLYGCTYGLLNLMQDRFGVTYSLCDMTDEESIRQKLMPTTRVIYVETPINPTMELVDLKLVAKIAKEIGACVVVDNTFMSPYLQRPIEHGCDIVIHSATKFIGGHGDVIAGVAAGPQSIMDTIRMTSLKDIGGIIGPFDAYLLIRGLKTLGVRMDRHCENGQKVAEFLDQHPKVAKVHYPGLSRFPQYELACRQMDGFGGLLAFELKGGMEAGIRMMNNVQLCKRAVSLGDVDSLIQHPASMTHSIIPLQEREKMGITDGLIRLSVGIEDIEDILDDLEAALAFA